MKSRIFQGDGADAVVHPDFLIDLRTFADLAPELLCNIAEEYVLYREKGLEPLGSPSASEVTTVLPANNRGNAKSIIGISGFLFDYFTSLKEYKKREEGRNAFIESIVSDMIEVAGLDERQGSNIRAFLKSLDKHSEKYISKAMERATEEFGIASFQGIGTAVDVRAVIPQLYRFEDDIREYEKHMHIDHFVPRGTISIRLTRFPGERVVFQVTERELELLVAGLQALKADMVEAKEKIPPVSYIKMQTMPNPVSEDRAR